MRARYPWRAISRVAIAAIAVTGLIVFWTYLPIPLFPIDFSVGWIGVVSTLCSALWPPLLLLAALVLAAMGRWLVVAAILLLVVLVLYWGPIIPFLIAVSIFGI